LSLQTLQRHRIPHQFVRQKFQRNRPAEFRVLRFVDNTHTSAAEFFQHKIMRNNLPVHPAGILPSSLEVNNVLFATQIVYESILAPICGTASMDMPAKIEFLKSAIASQQNTLRLQTALAGMLFVLGLTVVMLSFVNPGLLLAETLKTGQT